ncbi:MAG: SCO family protein [Alphaproteobacteria bacterium]|nr:SCO family protein [Alphaproteobacteria bacterium]
MLKFIIILLINVHLANANTEVGGSFSLIDQHGKVVTDKSLHGKKTLLYFGYTFCPDFCPATLNNLTLLLNEMPKNQVDKLNVVFVTVDPERDTKQLLSEYMTNFDPHIKALTGTKEQINDIVKKFKVYAAKVENAENPDLYTVNHTTIMFLFDENMKLITAFPHDFKNTDVIQYLTQ